MSLSSINIPSYPDVPIAPGVPTVLRNPQAAPGSLVNSVANAAIGAAQGIVGGAAQAVGQGIAAVNGAISNVQNLTGGSFGSVGSLVSGAFGDPSSLLNDDAASTTGGQSFTPVWGIRLAGTTTPLVTPDTFKVFDYRQEWRLPNYPMEQGSFQSYNKVQMPFEGRIEMTKGRGVSNDSAINQFLNTINAAANSTALYDIDAGDIVYQNVSIQSINYRRTNTNGVSLLTIELPVLEIRLAPTSTFTNTASPNGADSVNGGTVQPIPVTTSANTTEDIDFGDEPTTGLQAQTGNADPQTSVASTSQLPASTQSAILNTVTPAVAATAPNTPIPGLNSGGPAIPQNVLGQVTGLVSNNGPFITLSGSPVNMTAMMNEGITGYCQDTSSGNVLSVTFSAAGTQTVKSSPKLVIQ